MTNERIEAAAEAIKCRWPNAAQEFAGDEDQVARALAEAALGVEPPVGGWPSALIARDPDGALEVVAAVGDDDEQEKARAYEQGGYEVRRYALAASVDDEIDRSQRFREIAKLLTSQGSSATRERLASWLRYLADEDRLSRPSSRGSS